MSAIAMYLDELESVYRLEPAPDALWMSLFADGLEEALGGRVYVDDAGRVRARQSAESLSTKAAPNGYLLRGINRRILETNVEWKRRRDHARDHRPARR